MSRKAWSKPPGSVEHPGRLEVPTLANLARKPSRRRLPQCRICLAEEPLDNGICKDRAACEERQPPLTLWRSCDCGQRASGPP